MVRIWAKVMKDDAIVKSTVYEREREFEVDDFFEYLTDICHTLDLATPILLAKHVYYFVAFNTTKFIGEDFTEEINFDSLVIEDASVI